MWAEILISAFLGAILSIIVTAFFEKLKKPILSMEIENHELVDYSTSVPPRLARTAIFLYVRLRNNDLSRIEKWFTSRDPAFNCRGVISFHRPDGTNLFGRKMVLRWTDSPEPIGVDINKAERNSTMVVYPGESQSFNIASRYNNEEDCYGWSNRSYLEPLWRNPDWKLPPGLYLVKVVITTSGNKTEGIFRLCNDVPVNDFRLEPAQKGDKVID
jgi:hypothetical protein